MLVPHAPVLDKAAIVRERLTMIRVWDTLQKQKCDIYGKTVRVTTIKV